MLIIMQRDFAARSERNRQHSADRPQNNRPDHETADDHYLNRIKRQEGEGIQGEDEESRRGPWAPRCLGE